MTFFPGLWADVTWAGNWIAFLDAILQASILSSTPTRDLVVPTEIEEVVIDPGLLLQFAPQNTESAGT